MRSAAPAASLTRLAASALSLILAITPLDAAKVLAKALGYLGALYAAGAFLFLALFPETPASLARSVKRRAVFWAVVAATAAGGLALTRAAFLGGGWEMALDPALLGLVLDSALGDSAQLRAIGAALMVVAAALAGRWAVFVGLAGGLLMLTGVTMVGHAAAATPVGVWQAMLLVHLAAAAFWIGALYPLHRFAGHAGPAATAAAMERFGRVAAWWVAALVIAGLPLAVRLVGGVDALIGAPYGRLLVLKLLLVGGLLLLAAWHKWRLAPTLGAAGAEARLTASIGRERWLAAAIVVATALLTSLTGPPA